MEQAKLFSVELHKLSDTSKLSPTFWFQAYIKDSGGDPLLPVENSKNK
jgi:hypothetical protein